MSNLNISDLDGFELLSDKETFLNALNNESANLYGRGGCYVPPPPPCNLGSKSKKAKGSKSKKIKSKSKGGGCMIFPMPCVPVIPHCY